MIQEGALFPAAEYMLREGYLEWKDGSVDITPIYITGFNYWAEVDEALLIKKHGRANPQRMTGCYTTFDWPFTSFRGDDMHWPEMNTKVNGYYLRIDSMPCALRYFGEHYLQGNGSLTIQWGEDPLIRLTGQVHISSITEEDIEKACLEVQKWVSPPRTS